MTNEQQQKELRDIIKRLEQLEDEFHPCEGVRISTAVLELSHLLDD